jgi:hypothetical protein
LQVRGGREEKKVGSQKMGTKDTSNDSNRGYQFAGDRRGWQNYSQDPEAGGNKRMIFLQKNRCNKHIFAARKRRSWLLFAAAIAIIYQKVTIHR